MVDINLATFTGLRVNYVPTVAPETGIATVSFGAFSATLNNVLSSGVYSDGMPWVQVAPGGGTMSAKTPPVETTGRIRHGFMLNVYRDQPGGQGIDSLSAPDTWRAGFTAGLLPEMPLALTDGDMLFFGVGSEGTNSSGRSAWRDGFLDDQAWLHIRTTVPAANTFSPPAFWLPKFKKDRPEYVVDVDAIMSWLPSLSTAGMTRPVTWAQVAAYFDRPAASIARNSGRSSGGYESWVARGLSLISSSNYDNYVAAVFELAMMGLIGDNWSTADKRACLIRMLQYGGQLGEALIQQGGFYTQDGGHRGSQFAPIVLWLAATGQLGKAPRLFENYLSGNVPGQFFRWTPERLATLEPHDGGGKPLMSRRRKVLSVSGTSMTIQSHGSNAYEDGTNYNFNGTKLVRESDGAEAIIVSSSVNNTAIPIKVDAQPTVPFAVDDVVYCAPIRPWLVGEPEWNLSGRGLSRYSSSPRTGYRTLNTAEAPILFLTALGILPEFDAVLATRDYVAAAATGTYPVADPASRFNRSVVTSYNLALVGNGTTDSANHWGVQMFDAHYAGLKDGASSRYSSTFSLAHMDHWVDPSDLSTLFVEITGQDAATPAVVDGPVGTVREKGLRGGYWVAGSDDARPILRLSEGKYFLEFDGVDDFLQFGDRDHFLSRGYHIFAKVQELTGNANSRLIYASTGSTGTSDYSARLGFSDETRLLHFGHGPSDKDDGADLSEAGTGLLPLSLAEASMKPNNDMTLRRDGAVIGAATVSRQFYSGQRFSYLGCGATFFAPKAFAKFALHGFAMAHGSGELSDTEAATVRAALG